MAINLDERYPGRANPKSLSYPQGSFKNRTSPTSKDGTYLEQDWANDWAGFFQRMMAVAEISPNGVVDTAESSQYFDALAKIISDATPDASTTKKGLMKIATNAEAQALTDDTKALTPKKLADAFKGSNQLLSSNGYQKLPGGLIIQWGRDTSGMNAQTETDLPIAFPNEFLLGVPVDFGKNTDQATIGAWDARKSTLSKIFIYWNVRPSDFAFLALGY